MLRRRIAGASIVLALAAALVWALLPRPVARISEALPAATALPQQATKDDGPSLPDAAAHPQPLSALHNPDGSAIPCSLQMGTETWEPPSSGWPTTVHDLYRGSTTVVLATLTRTRGYWGPVRSNYANWGDAADLMPYTASNFQVQQAYKGSAGRWLQVVDSGANQDNIATCQNRVPVRAGWPLPATQRQQYVLFLDAQGEEADGPIDRWPVIDGVVHPDHDIQPRAFRLDEIITSQVVGPMPLAQFIAAMQAS